MVTCPAVKRCEGDSELRIRWRWTLVSDGLTIPLLQPAAVQAACVTSVLYNEPQNLFDTSNLRPVALSVQAILDAHHCLGTGLLLSEQISCEATSSHPLCSSIARQLP